MRALRTTTTGLRPSRQVALALAPRSPKRRFLDQPRTDRSTHRTTPLRRSLDRFRTPATQSHAIHTHSSSLFGRRARWEPLGHWKRAQRRLNVQFKPRPIIIIPASLRSRLKQAAAATNSHAATTMGTNLRQKQTAALNRMLNFNVPLADSEGGVVNPSEWSDHVRSAYVPACLHAAPLPCRACVNRSHRPRSNPIPVQPHHSGRC